MPAKKRTKELDEQIARMYQAGIKISEMRKRLNVWHGVIYKSLREQGIPLTRNTNTIPKEDYKKIAQMYQDKIGYESIAKQLGYRKRHVRQVIVDQGIKIQLPTWLRYPIDNTVFDFIDNELSAYWLGFIFADGCVSGNRLSIDLHAKDKLHLEKIRTFLKTEKPLFEYQRKSPKAIFAVGNNHLSQRLKELGILVDRPDINITVSQVPLSLMNHFIRGYFDGDGSARKKRVTIRFCGQIDILEWLKSHFRIVLNAECERKIQPYKHTDKLFALGFSPSDSLSIRNYLYQDSTIWLERKRDITDKWK